MSDQSRPEVGERRRRREEQRRRALADAQGAGAATDTPAAALEERPRVVSRRELRQRAAEAGGASTGATARPAAAPERPRTTVAVGPDAGDPPARTSAGSSSAAGADVVAGRPSRRALRAASRSVAGADTGGRGGDGPVPVVQPPTTTAGIRRVSAAGELSEVEVTGAGTNGGPAQRASRTGGAQSGARPAGEDGRGERATGSPPAAPAEDRPVAPAEDPSAEPTGAWLPTGAPAPAAPPPRWTAVEPSPMGWAPVPRPQQEPVVQDAPGAGSVPADGDGVGVDRTDAEPDGTDEERRDATHPYSWLQIVVLVVVAFVLGMLIVTGVRQAMSQATEEQQGTGASVMTSAGPNPPETGEQ